jgi:histidinol dehydrogenase
MTALVAKIAGVPRVVVVSPPPIPDVILAACAIAGADEVYQIGGAQAVAALAYGTKSIRRVDKIVGPGNKYVTEAKRQVYGVVDVDMLAGPSEVLIIADESADASFVAADLLAQAEHDPDARCVLATPSKNLAAAVKKETAKQLRTLPRKKIIKASLDGAAIVLTKNLAEAVLFANDYAPEHLEVITKNPRKVAEKVKNAGAIFVGPYSPVAMGDYCSGGNHVLPTGGSARFCSPLTVRDFLKTSCVQEAGEKGLQKIAEALKSLAESEGLTAHAESVRKRLYPKKGI